MSILGRITGMSRGHHEAERQPQSAELADLQRRLSRVDDDIDLIQANAQAVMLRRQAVAASIAKLTERAAAGTLDDPGRLAEALRQQRELSADDASERRLSALRVEQESLQQQMHGARRRAAREAYLGAVQRYANACAALPGLAVQVREAAVAAGMMLTPDNSPHLVGRAIQIGGALVDIPPQTETI